MLVALCSEGVKQILDFPLTDGRSDGHEEIRRAEVAIVFWDLVFENEMISEGVPSEVGKHPMVLVTVVPVMGEYQVRSEIRFQLLEEFLDLGTDEWKEGVAEVAHDDPFVSSPSKKRGSTSIGFLLALRARAEHHPSNVKAGILGKQRKNRATATDLDVIAVRTEAQQPTKGSAARSE